MSQALQRVHIHHPALLKITRITPQGEETIMDGLSSLQEGRLESDVIFPIQTPAVLKVTTLSGASYRFIIAAKIMIVEHLNDIGDVNVPSPTNKYLLYWDAATSLWKCQALADYSLAELGTKLLNHIDDVDAPSPHDRSFLRRNTASAKWQAVKGYEFGMAIRPWQWELAFFNWTTTATQSGTIVDKVYGIFRIDTGATAGSTARGTGYNFGWFAYHQDDFEWYAHFTRRQMSANGRAWLKIDQDTADDPTDKAIGWRLDNNALKGIVHDGTTLTVVDLDVTLAIHEGARLFLKFIKGSKIEWYVNGVKKGESTNIPTTQLQATTYPVLAVANGADAQSNRVEIWRHGWIMGV